MVVYWIVIKFFQPSDDDRYFLVVEGGARLCCHFGKNKIKFKSCFPFKATQKIPLLFNGVGVSDGDRIFSVTT
jgi:hypothetical protein